MIKNLIILVLSCWIFMLYYKKDSNPILINSACNYAGIPVNVENFNDDDVAEADEETEETVVNIMSYTGLPTNFAMLISDSIANACAFIDKSEKRFIVYNKEFMDSVKRVTKTNWSVRSILAHEIAHHLSGHTLPNNGSCQKINELEADRFSGFVLGKMGANMQQALIAMELFGDENESENHPAKMCRMKAITDGWQKAMVKNITNITVSEKNKSSIPEKLGIDISLSEIDTFLSNWATYQNKNKMAEYSNYYSSQFQGIKRVWTNAPDTAKYYNQTQWLEDRKAMYGQAKNVSVVVSNIKIIDKDNNGITLLFTQTWSSDLYKDTGEKMMKIYKNQTDKNIYIVYEEMLNSYKLL
ncbi:MAG TPA: hypothetical protein PK431_13545 [Chitinophagales bacterium]|nr:hypothetical protein [Chitinophagales bacterium]